jgi:hypothetical protein
MEAELCPERSRIGPDLATNAHEEKSRFLASYDYEPSFVHEALPTPVVVAQNTVRHDYTEVAKQVLDDVINKFGSDTQYMNENYGNQISVEEARERVLAYLDDLSDENTRLRDVVDIKFHSELSSYAAMIKKNGQYTLWINSSKSNSFMRERGLNCLLDHEIGTHFCRMHNDSAQRWSSGRRKLYGMKSWGRERCDVQTEEGFASVNTSLACKHKQLWFPCLLYYCASMAAMMSFRELYEHMATYVADDSERWSLVLRAAGYQGASRTEVQVNGWGKDQAYLEGAIYVLKRLRSVKCARSLYWGKVTFKDIQSVKVKRIVSNDLLFPLFLTNEASYQNELNEIFQQNRLGEISEDFNFERVVGVKSSGILHAKMRARRMRQIPKVVEQENIDPAYANDVYSKINVDQDGEIDEPEPEAEPPLIKDDMRTNAVAIVG